MNKEKYVLCRMSSRLLTVGLIIILGVIIHIISLFEGAVQTSEELLYIMSQCRIMLQYALASLVILIGGVLLLDCVYKGKVR